MKTAECKPGMHLWTMYSYHPEEVLEVEVLPPQEPIYQDFVWCRLINCPPGWKSPRNIRASRLHKTKKDVLKHAIEELGASIDEREQKIERLQEEITQRVALQQTLIEQYDKEVCNEQA